MVFRLLGKGTGSIEAIGPDILSVSSSHDVADLLLLWCVKVLYLLMILMLTRLPHECRFQR